MSGLEVVSPGFLCLIQDLGRQGSAHLGLSAGGPMDLHAFCWGNKILGNPANTTAIEITIGQAIFRAQQDLTLALTGAEMQATIDGQPQNNWQRFELKRGQTLSLGTVIRGLRAYLAIAGGFDVPLVFNSAATVCRNQLGGLASADAKFGLGNKLHQGDKLPLANMPLRQLAQNHHRIPRQFIPSYPNKLTLNVIESYQCDTFSAEQKTLFYQSHYLVTPHSDRMGILLAGAPITSALTGIISEGIAPGAIQIPPDGQPIILLNDRQTLGGYPKLGCITRRDQSRIAQARPGAVLRFRRANLEQQTKKWCEFMKFFSL